MLIKYVLPNVIFGPGLASIVCRVVVSVVVIVHFYPPVTGQFQTLNIGQSVHFLLQGQLRAWRNPHLLKSFQCFNVSLGFVKFFFTEFAAS